MGEKLEKLREVERIQNTGTQRSGTLWLQSPKVKN
jgi:hypothetical protein